MNKRSGSLLLAGIFLWKAPAFSQAKSCADPSAPRIGLFTASSLTGSTGDQKLLEFKQRALTAERRLRTELEKQLPSNACLVTDLKVFDNPANFPQLKGSLSLLIHAKPSFERANVAAISVTATTVQGVYFEQQLLMFTLPLLVEADSNYADEAKGVIMMLSMTSENLKKLGGVQHQGDAR